MGYKNINVWKFCEIPYINSIGEKFYREKSLKIL